MFSHLFSHFSIILIVVSAIGCSSLDEQKRDEVKLISPYSGIRIENLTYYQNGNTLKVSGTVRKRKTSRVITNGHVDIRVFAESGEMLATKTVDHSPRIITRNAMSARFNATLPVKFPENGIIEARYHKPHLDRFELECSCKSSTSTAGGK